MVLSNYIGVVICKSWCLGQMRVASIYRHPEDEINLEVSKDSPETFLQTYIMYLLYNALIVV